MNRIRPHETIDPVAIVERRFDTGVLSINYAEAGSGTPVVLLHGGSARWQHLERLIAPLADHRRVFAIDLRGHGLSGRTPGRYRLNDYADDLIAFLERVTGPAGVFGHSLGGQVATVAAARRTDLVNALALGDTPLSGKTLHPRLRADRPMHQLWRGLAAAGGPSEKIAGALRSMTVRAFEGRSGRADEVMSPESPWFTFMAGCLRDLDPSMLDAVMEFDEMHAGYEAERLLPAILCPVLLIQADPARGAGLSDSEVAAARRLLRNVRVVRVADAGHALYLERIGPILQEFFD